MVSSMCQHLSLWADLTRNRPGEPGAILRRNGDEIELVELHWGLKPRGPEERSAIDIRSERRRSQVTGACACLRVLVVNRSRCATGKVVVHHSQRRLVLFRRYMAAGFGALAGVRCRPHDRGQSGRRPLQQPLDGRDPAQVPDGVARSNVIGGGTAPAPTGRELSRGSIPPRLERGRRFRDL